MELQINIRVFGKVQGVWFRQTTKNKADYLNIKGIVMNEVDGSVYISARGTEENLKELVAYCKSGPKLAEVSNVMVEEEKLLDHTDFSIIR